MKLPGLGPQAGRGPASLVRSDVANLGHQSEWLNSGNVLDPADTPPKGHLNIIDVREARDIGSPSRTL
jgi:hypothetical protein